MQQQLLLMPNEKSIRERFLKFHEDNPAVYDEIVAIARTMRERGVKLMGIALIFERLRWLHFIEVLTEEPYKLSNDFRAEYARFIMRQEADLAGFFRTRELRRKA